MNLQPFLPLAAFVSLKMLCMPRYLNGYGTHPTLFAWVGQFQMFHNSVGLILRLL